MALRTGKLPSEMLKKILKNRGANDPRVVMGPGIGEDAAVVRLGKVLLVLKTDPVTYAADLIGWYAVNINANDVVTRGAAPAWFQATILLPQGSEMSLAEDISKQISDAAKGLGIAVTGGHTEVTPGIDHPIVVGDMHGIVQSAKPVSTSGARAGDMIVMTKSAGIEGTALIAREKKDELLKTMGTKFVDKAANYLYDPGLSIVREATIALKFNVSAMHDPTEGGVAMGAEEIAQASGRPVEIWLDKVNVRKETAKLCAKYGLDPLGLLGSGALLATFKPADAERYVAALRKMGIQAAVIGKVLTGKGKSRLVSGRKVIPLSSSERDEVLKVLSP
jgi:hydrogenase maturation factor